MNVGMVARIEAKLGGLKVNTPPESQISGAVWAALFALGQEKNRHAVADLCVEGEQTVSNLDVMVDNTED